MSDIAGCPKAREFDWRLRWALGTVFLRRSELASSKQGLKPDEESRMKPRMRVEMRRVAVLAPVAITVFVAVDASSRGALAASFPAWARPEAAQTGLARHSGEDAVVLVNEWDLTLKDGTRTGTRRLAIQVLTEKGRPHASLALARGPFESFHKVKTWILRPNGKVEAFGEDEGALLSYDDHRILDDTEVLVVEPRGLAPGCTVAMQYGFTSSAEIPQDVFSIQDSIPVLRASVKTDARRGWKVRAKVVSGKNPGPSDVTSEGMWVFTDVPGRPAAEDPDAHVPPRTQLALDYLPPGGDSPFKDWGSTAQWGVDLFRLDPGPSPLLEAELARVKAQVADAVEGAGALARKLRYFGIEIGWGGYRPRAPETTLARAFGDCKDKSQLMVALLRRAGVDAVPVLAVAPSDRHVDEGLSGPRQFNHCVVGIPWEGRTRLPGMTVVAAPGVGAIRIFDPTLSDASPQDVSLHLEGGAGLVLDPRTTGLVRFPGSAPKENILETAYTWRLDEGGTLHARTIERYHGALRARLEGEEGEPITRKDLRRRVFAALSRNVPGIADLEVSEVRRDPAGFWYYEASYRLDAALADFGGADVLDLFVLRDIDTFPLPVEEERGSAHQAVLATYRDRAEIDAGGRSILDLPVPVDTVNSLGSVHLAAHGDGARVVIEREAVTSEREILPARRADAEALRQSLRRVNGAILAFAKPASPAATSSDPP